MQTDETSQEGDQEICSGPVFHQESSAPDQHSNSDPAQGDSAASGNLNEILELELCTENNGDSDLEDPGPGVTPTDYLDGALFSQKGEEVYDGDVDDGDMESDNEPINNNELDSGNKLAETPFDPNTQVMLDPNTPVNIQDLEAGPEGGPEAQRVNGAEPLTTESLSELDDEEPIRPPPGTSEVK
jgi:hypothetical protein